MTETDDDAFVDKARQALRDSEHELGADVQSRLQQARRQAIAAAEEGRPKLFRPWVWAPVGSAAVVALAVVLYVGQGQELPYPAGEEFTVAQDVELLDELEFIAWMVQDERASG